jgi:glutamate dehydrogenase
VVGEGGNLGMTQLGRIEFALHGGCSTPTSSTTPPASTPRTTRSTSRSCYDNYRQNQAISVMERMSVARLGSKQHFIQVLERKGRLDRALEYLPTDTEFTERKAAGLGLTRPELSVLLSYAKIVAFEELLNSDVPEDPYLSKELMRYFPSALQQGYGEHMQRHRLRREIIATAVTNSMVNRMGATFLLRMQEDTGRNSAQIAKAYSIAREVLDSRAMWAGIDALDSQVEETVQVDALLAIWSLLRGMTRWLLNRPGDRFDIAEAVMRFKPSLDQLRSGLGKVLSTTELTELNDATARWSVAGVPELLSAQLASISYLHSALDIIEVASASGQSVLEVAKVYSILGESLTLKWLQQRIDELPVEGRWHALARGSMRDELQQQQGALVAQVLRQGEGDTTSRVQRWMEQGGDTLKFTLSMFADMRALRSMDYATASVAVRRLAQLVIAGER